MTRTLLIATQDGFWIGEITADSWTARASGLDGQHVTSVIAREGVILAGTTDGIFRSDDEGETWLEMSEGLVTRHVRWLAFHPDISDREFAGTEPAAIFVSTDGARTWRVRPEVAALRVEHGWFLPYSPEPGCVRGFAFHGERGYAAVEVGGLLRSDDAGETWRLAAGSPGTPHFETLPPDDQLAADVHSVAVHPSDADLVFAATHAGLFRSRDGGARWQKISEDCYSRALWLDPDDAEHIVFGPATRRGWHGSIIETRDGGASWQRADAGLETPFASDTLIERFEQAGDTLLAVRSDGRLLTAPLATLVWEPILPTLPRVEAVTTMQA